jgi:hypothetical protein
MDIFLVFEEIVQFLPDETTLQHCAEYVNTLLPPCLKNVRILKALRQK